MNTRIHDTVWALGVRARDKLAQFGLLGPGEGILFRLVKPASAVALGDTTAVIGEGMSITAPNRYTGMRYIRAGLYERALSRLFRTLVKPRMTVVDLGANVGYFTVMASGLVGEGGKVYSFEPDPHAFAYLQRNVGLNRCTNVEATNLAISDSTGKEWFNTDPGLAEGYLAHSPGKNSAMVDVVSLDEYFGLRGWPSVHLVKMDVEGSEQAALNGMRSLAKRNIKMMIIMEYSPKTLRRTNNSPDAIAAILQEIGYSRGQIIERRMRPFSVKKGLPHSGATYNLFFD